MCAAHGYSGAMNKKKMDREMQIEEFEAALNTPPMAEEVADALFDRAVDLAHHHFGKATTDDHIEWAYQQLVGNWQWGRGEAGVGTVH